MSTCVRPGRKGGSHQTAGFNRMNGVHVPCSADKVTANPCCPELRLRPWTRLLAEQRCLPTCAPQARGSMAARSGETPGGAQEEQESQPNPQPQPQPQPGAAPPLKPQSQPQPQPKQGAHQGSGQGP